MPRGTPNTPAAQLPFERPTIFSVRVKVRSAANEIEMAADNMADAKHRTSAFDVVSKLRELANSIEVPLP